TDALFVITDALFVIADALFVVAYALFVIADGLFVIADGLFVIADGLFVIADGLFVIAGGLFAITGAPDVITNSLEVVTVGREKRVNKRWLASRNHGLVRHLEWTHFCGGVGFHRISGPASLRRQTFPLAALYHLRASSTSCRSRRIRLCCRMVVSWPRLRMASTVYRLTLRTAMASLTVIRPLSALSSAACFGGAS